MGLTGQASASSSPASRGSRLDDAGFIMVALLVSMAVTAVWMAAALPAWRQQVQREQEAELIFRGEAIARAIYLYRQKNGQTLPPSLDTLVSQRFLRKKYIDPITGKDFLPVAGATAAPGGAAAGGNLQGGIVGVRSTSNATSIRIYNNQQTYSQWAFDFTLEQLRAGGGPVIGVPGGVPGGPGQGGVGGRGGVGTGGRGGGGAGGRGQGGVRGGGDGGIAPIVPPAPAGGRGTGGFGGGRAGG